MADRVRRSRKSSCCEALVVTGEERMAWRKAAVRMKRRIADWPWQPKERGEQRADWQTGLTGR